MIKLHLYITSKENLVLDWYPIQDVSSWIPCENSDWKHWNNQWMPHSRPFNRIIMIHSFDYLTYRFADKEYEYSDTFLIKATEKFLKEIYEFLGHFLDIQSENELKVEYDEKYSKVLSCNVGKKKAG